MGTTTIMFSEDLEFNIDELTIPELTPEEKSIVYLYVKFTENMREVEKLFRVYRCNLYLMLNHYTFFSNDTVKRKIPSDTSEDIEINTFIINLLSSGRTLIEALDRFTSEYFPQKNDFKNEHISKLYDNKFTYRLLNHLRNYSQHGYLPVSSNGNNFYFDLHEISSAPHISKPSHLKKDLPRICQEIYEKYNDYPRIAFTKSLVEYNFFIHELYAEFWEFIENKYNKVRNSMNALLIKKPEMIYHSENAYDGYVFYKDDADIINCFAQNKDQNKLFLKFKNNAVTSLEKEKKIKENFDKTISWK